ncbi:hypothetical protein EUX98_g3320 [Antrodiella citrinella]|uniref:Uncharacterized protein n=1 Tax=Antrodiella citrinella TaxID=2447956 RepID=A0A4S4MZN5_9APHY|nr:hypothetical protein EUX98_g3320 [Antrodiella citrinella]
MAKKPTQQNPRTPKTPHAAAQTLWSTPPPSGGSGSGSVHPAPESAYDVTNHQGGPKSDEHGSAKDAPVSPTYPVSPPKSPTPQSPTPGQSVLTTFTTQTGAARNAAVAKDVAAVEELLGTMRLTLTAVGSTMDTLAEQTVHVAALGPAIDATHQIGLVRKQLDDQHRRQEQRMVEMKAMLKEEISDGQLQEKLREIAGVLVRECVKREIVERVRREVSDSVSEHGIGGAHISHEQLQEQIPQDMREQAIRYKRQLLEVKASLHNSEARRHNALIRSNSLDEPLIPLVRPFATPASSPILSRQPSSASAIPSPPAPEELPKEPSEPMTVPILEISEEFPKQEKPAVLEIDLTPPTPSPLFPRDLTGLMRLSPDDARALVREYGLEPLQIPEAGLFGEGFIGFGDDGPKSSREEDLNRFMSHIGVGFHLVPGPNAPRPASPDSPIAALVV